MLKIIDVETKYGNILALKGISLEVRSGEIVTIIGANGAGKTTTINTISGLVRATKGKVFFEDTDITNLPTDKIVGLGVVQAPEGRQIFPQLTVHENLMLGAYLRKDKAEIKKSVDSIHALFPRLYERRKQMGGTLSGGEQQMLSIGRALMSTPKLLLLDEPSLGLSPIFVQHIFEVIKEINNRGTTILLVEQNANIALSIANRGYVMETGYVTGEDDAKVLLTKESVRSAYLGHGG
ncbi:MAG: ABC transporter ATP-binding protein [Deferribacteraceae bacterium]|jgi:branched-chain amino acid transport system ATP-binding protein|nr:ABC transporter ATP-binding protein [Deferribacteraceae bacterium]